MIYVLMCCCARTGIHEFICLDVYTMPRFFPLVLRYSHVQHMHTGCFFLHTRIVASQYMYKSTYSRYFEHSALFMTRTTKFITETQQTKKYHHSSTLILRFTILRLSFTLRCIIYVYISIVVVRFYIYTTQHLYIRSVCMCARQQLDMHMCSIHYTHIYFSLDLDSSTEVSLWQALVPQKYESISIRLSNIICTHHALRVSNLGCF